MIDALNAARLVEADYYARETLDVSETLDIRGVQASIVLWQGLRVLLVRGTDERLDWLRFNLRFWPRVQAGDTRMWSRGFLRHGEAVYAFAKGKPLDCIVGHSLGAACAQIIGPSLGLPAIAFASPRPLYKGPQPERADLVTNYCRVDDLVTRLPPPAWGFKHVGKATWYRPARRHWGEDHRIPALLSIMDGSEACDVVASDNQVLQ